MFVTSKRCHSTLDYDHMPLTIRVRCETEIWLAIEQVHNGEIAHYTGKVNRGHHLPLVIK